MALELFNTAFKNDIYNNWYPEESKSYIRFKVAEVQEELGTNKHGSILRKDEIQRVIKHFGKPQHISDDDYLTYVSRLKQLDEW